LDSLAVSHFVAAALAAGAALAAALAWLRSSTRELLRREADSAREREALLDGERELRARLHAANETLRLRAEVLQRVLAASGELKAHLPLDAVLANVARAASASLGYRRVLLSLHDRADGLLVPRAHVGLPDAWPRLRDLRLPVERLAGPGGGGAAPPPSPLASTLPEEAAAGVVSVALLAAGQLVGVLELSGADPDAGASAVDPVVLDLFASQAVTAIRLARAYETTRLGSLRDSLTGLANHGHFQETLYRELARHERSRESLVLLLVDLDDFKTVNDRHGERDARRGAPPEGRRRLSGAGGPPGARPHDRLHRRRRLPRGRRGEGAARRVRRPGALRRQEDGEEPRRPLHEGASVGRGAPHGADVRPVRRVTAGQPATANRSGQAAASPA